MLKTTALLVFSLLTAAFLPACGSKDNNTDALLLLISSCTLSGTITDMSGMAANGDTVHFYLDDTDTNIANGTNAAYTLTWNGGTGIGNSMNYSVNVFNVPAGPYYLMAYDVSTVFLVYGFTNDSPPFAYGVAPVTVNVSCGATGSLRIKDT